MHYPLIIKILVPVYGIFIHQTGFCDYMFYSTAFISSIAGRAGSAYIVAAARPGGFVLAVVSTLMSSISSGFYNCKIVYLNGLVEHIPL